VTSVYLNMLIAICYRFLCSELTVLHYSIFASRNMVESSLLLVHISVLLFSTVAHLFIDRVDV
jgi:hypothetical protein